MDTIAFLACENTEVMYIAEIRDMILISGFLNALSHYLRKEL